MDKHYSGGLTQERFLFSEIRIAARLRLEGASDKEIKDRARAENLFQYPTERKLTSTARVCLKRLDALDSQTLTERLVNAPASEGRQINLYAIMLQNGVVYDFMTEVIGEKFRAGRRDFSSGDVYAFFERLEKNYPAAADWQESTRKRIAEMLRQFLVECEFLSDSRSDRLQNVLLCPALEERMRQTGDSAALAAFGVLE